MHNNKKAISDVVSTVLIILLVVAAIAIIGSIILNAVNKGGTSVNSALACQQLNLKPTNCSIGATTTNGVVQLGASTSDFTISSISMIFVKADGSTTVAAATNPVTLTTVGSTAIANPALTNAGYTSLQVGATIRLSDGTSATCEPKPSESVACR